MSTLYGDLEGLLATVRRRGEQHAIAQEAAAEEQASRRLAEARAEAEALRAPRLEDGRRAADATYRKRIADATLARNARRLAARDRRASEIFDAAAARLRTRYGDGVPVDVARRLAHQAARFLPAGTITLRLDAASLARLSDGDVATWATDTHTFVLGDTPLSDGVGLRAHSGRVSVDATLEGRLATARDHLRGRVDAILHGAHPPRTETSEG